MSDIATGMGVLRTLNILVFVLVATTGCDGNGEGVFMGRTGMTGEEYASGAKRAAAVAAAHKPVLKKQLESQGIQWGAEVFVRIFKEERELELWLRKGKKFVLFRSYIIAAMSGKLGPKEKEGDLQAPEGFYYVTPDRMKPDSRYHLAFNVGYPNRYDRLHGRTGSFIMVHGARASIGCFAMTDEKIEEIYTLCDSALHAGQKFFRVHSFPFRMTEERMSTAEDQRWYSFWQNLQTGYLWFEEHGVPPNVNVYKKRYKFGF